MNALQNSMFWGISSVCMHVGKCMICERSGTANDGGESCTGKIVYVKGEAWTFEEYHNLHDAHLTWVAPPPLIILCAIIK